MNNMFQDIFLEYTISKKSSTTLTAFSIIYPSEVSHFIFLFQSTHIFGARKCGRKSNVIPIKRRYTQSKIPYFYMYQKARSCSHIAAIIKLCCSNYIGSLTLKRCCNCNPILHIFLKNLQNNMHKAVGFTLQ